jgi:hypothetical protein
MNTVNLTCKLKCISFIIVKLLVFTMYLYSQRLNTFVRSLISKELFEQFFIEIYKRLYQKILDDEGVPTLNKQEYEIVDMDTIRRKIELIENHEIKDDSDELPSEYSARKSNRKRKRVKQNADDLTSVVSKMSAEKSRKKVQKKQR